MRESLSDTDLHLFCLRWAAWHKAHGLIAPPMQKGILARLQPGRVRPPPIVRLSAELSIFNMAVNAQPDSPAKQTFILFYLYPARSVKELAAAQNLSLDAVYRRLRRYRRTAYRAARALDESARAARLLRFEGEPQSLYREGFARL